MSPDRAVWETPRHTDKKAFQLRKQEEREADRALRDFERHLKEEEQEDSWSRSQQE